MKLPTIKIIFPSLPKVFSCLFAIHSSLYSCPQILLTCFLSLYSSLHVLEFCINEIITVCWLFAWFLSLRIMILNEKYFLMLNRILLWIYCYLFSCLPWWTFELFSIWGYYNKTAMNIHIQVSVWKNVFISLVKYLRWYLFTKMVFSI